MASTVEITILDPAYGAMTVTAWPLGSRTAAFSGTSITQDSTITSIYTFSNASATGLHRLNVFDTTSRLVWAGWIYLTTTGTNVACDTISDALLAYSLNSIGQIPVQSGTGSGQLSLSSGVIDANMKKVNGTDQTAMDLGSNQTTILNRLGAFTGTGVNTVLGFLRAQLRGDLSAPSDVGGTFDPATDSLEALRNNEPANFAALGVTSDGKISAVVTTEQLTNNNDKAGYSLADGQPVQLNAQGKQDVRDALGLDGTDRVATPGDVSANVVVSPLTGNVPQDIIRTTLYMRTADTGPYEIQQVTGADGSQVDFSLYERLELIIETADKTQLEAISLGSGLAVVNDGAGISFSVQSSTVEIETYAPSHYLWSLREPNEGDGNLGKVICGGTCQVGRFAQRRP